MNWSDIESYIRAHAPDLMAACEGVPRADIEACERGLGIVFPPMYVDFLLAMGARSGDYFPFGGQYDHDFYLLIDRLRYANYPTDRWFKVALQIDDSVDVLEEPYLDLGHAADGDTPMVTIQEGGPFQPEQVTPLGDTLAETLARTAFWGYGFGPRMLCVSTSCSNSEEMELVHEETMAILGKLGLSVQLAPSPHLSCLGGAGVSAMVFLHPDGRTVMTIDLGGEDARAIRRMAEVLIDALPGTSFC